ncbi:hypothetical protein [Oceanobacillus alkalisoli]|uniref:hypothetical protein n=1 Tax=Oceanobacillus alkalisoli TaxID=2925113 RepID=UPI001EEFA312|nr:hypothetical protein [Oceanobacillus alkalisoli]MCF3942116.1 hypothetical protein [Oceanobacillus alkalisoli]MCG5105019.1 hypothetical protein [Oceanobacillus alkalisoli]
MKQTPLEKIFWSIALPGFGQLLNGKIVKGLIFITAEFIINVKANLNQVIIYSFHGDMQMAIAETNYLWLMFYPCVYMFAIWDAYRDAGGGRNPYSFLPFVFSAYFGTVGLIYSSNLRILGLLIGPVFLPIIFFVIGACIGLAIIAIIQHMKKSPS